MLSENNNNNNKTTTTTATAKRKQQQQQQQHQLRQKYYKTITENINDPIILKIYLIYFISIKCILNFIFHVATQKVKIKSIQQEDI